MSTDMCKCNNNKEVFSNCGITTICQIGPTGYTGDTGPTGFTGAMSTNENAFIANFTTTGTIAQGSPVTLDTSLLTSTSITHTPGSADITLTPGTYLIEYSAVASAPSSTSVVIGLNLNGSIINSTNVSQPNVTAGSSQSLSSGAVLIAPNSPTNTLQVVANSTSGNIFNSGFNTIPNVSIRIVKLS